MNEPTRPIIPPPLAVIAGVARTLAREGTPAERFAAVCDRLRESLPADAVRLNLGQRRHDVLAAGEAAPSASGCVVDVVWADGQHATLEALGSTRTPAELRPILETTAAMLSIALPAYHAPASPGDDERRLHRLTIDALPVGLYVVDRDFRIILWNRKRETGTQGLRREDVLGRAIFEVLHRQSPEVLRHEFERVFNHGEVIESEQEVQAGGQDHVYRTTRLPLRLDGTAVSHVITIGVDLTETRAIQRLMHQTEKLAALGQLAAGVMHEINNPLATIGACAAAISSRLGASIEPTASEYLDIIESEVGRATNIVNGLLDFSRAGRVGGTPQLVELNELLERTLYLLQHHQRFRRLQVIRDFQAELPNVLGYEERLIQAMMAILLNAADATGGRGTVTLTTRGDAAAVVIELMDDGPGIPADVLPKIFEPFYTTKGPSRGTGLGLAICYGIVADHQGRLDVESVPGRTVFRIRLPTAKPEQTQ